MKRQYLGDSKDSFKWDYHDYLTAALGYPTLNVMLLMTPDDKTNQGKTHPTLFPAREEIIGFCHHLRNKRDVQFIKELPLATNSKYHVELHKEVTYLTTENRMNYFADISTEPRQVLFLDPDNGFEPEKSNCDKHVLYSDVDTLLNQISSEAVISVFQHYRYIPFERDLARIRERMPNGYTTALYWHSLMFVTISKTKEIIEKVIELNQQYALNYPVKVLL